MIHGFKQFRENYFHGDAELFNRLKSGQTPRALVIGCSDSRVDPALLMGSAPGDIFVLRNVANLVPPYSPDAGLHGVSAGIEYAVKILQVSDIVILGHSGCGGVAALLDEKLQQTEFIQQWVGIARPALDAIRRELEGKSHELKCRACEQAALLVSIDNLLSFPWIKARVDRGELAIHGWYFDLHTGQLLAYDPAVAEFVELA
jgi:carbonic anhydrase